ncbi:hypothetical protein ACFQ7A_12070 [Streptomyces sp. NPDC056528]|uniref:hypothetical protein n=1 Tax=Streptomyces sp. NPDC056528 TaxID=3345854 RepID=UPI00368A3986
MTRWCFPDNTVLCNFASIDRLDLLRTVLDGRGRWTEAVAYEARSSALAAHPRLADVLLEGWLGEPLVIDMEEEADQVERVRRAAFGGTAARPLQHLGEAQTLHVIRNWQDFKESIWLSDDRAACDFAERQGITTWRTKDVMAHGCSRGDISPLQAFALLQQMRSQGRSLDVPPTAQHLR